MFAYQKFKDIKVQMFAERSALPGLPKCFNKKLLGRTRVVIDCTELLIQTSSDYEQQGNQYSQCKSHATAKVLIGTAPSGACVFVSDCYEGCISDHQIVSESGFLEYLNPHDMVLADRGFDIEDKVVEKGATLNIPPFLKGKQKFTHSESMKTKVIARARIHVQRFNQRFKRYRILQGIIPQDSREMLSQLVYVACCLCNFDEPLCK